MIEEGEADGAVAALVFGALAQKVRAAHRFLEDHERAGVLAQRLTGGGGVAGTQRIHPAQFDRVHAERLGDALHVHFDGELGLRRAEAAERAVGRSVGEHCAAADVDVVAAVGTGGVDAAAREHHRAQRDVSAAVEDDLDVHRHQAAVWVRPVRCRTIDG